MVIKVTVHAFSVPGDQEIYTTIFVAAAVFHVTFTGNMAGAGLAIGVGHLDADKEGKKGERAHKSSTFDDVEHLELQISNFNSKIYG
jgi:hypothetical protein